METNKITVDSQDWNDMTPEEVGYEGIDTAFYRYTTPKLQTFNYFVADARQSDEDPTVLMTMPFGARLESPDGFQARKASVFAKHRGARVAIAERRGVSIDPLNPLKTRGDRETFVQLFRSFNGNQDSQALDHLDGFTRILGLKKGDVLEIAGESQAGDQAAALTRVIAKGMYPIQYGISNVDIIDPVNALDGLPLPYKLKLLSNLLNIEPSRRTKYLDENTRIGHGIGLYETISPENARGLQYVGRRQALAVHLGGAGLRRGIDRVFRDLFADEAARAILADTEISFYRARHSTVAPQADIEAAIDNIRSFGGNVQGLTLVGSDDDDIVGHHAFTAFEREGKFAEWQRNHRLAA